MIAQFLSTPSRAVASFSTGHLFLINSRGAKRHGPHERRWEARRVGAAVVETRRFTTTRLTGAGLQGLQQFATPFEARVEEKFLGQGFGVAHVGVSDEVLDLEQGRRMHAEFRQPEAQQ
jgi:hypothetical protein